MSWINGGSAEGYEQRLTEPIVQSDTSVATAHIAVAMPFSYSR